MIKRKLFLTSALMGLIIGASAQSLPQKSVLDPQLLHAAKSGNFESLITGVPHNISNRDTRSTQSSIQQIRVTVVVDDAEEWIENAWVKTLSPSVITDNVVTLTVTPKDLVRLSELKGVKRVNAPRQFSVSLNRARVATGVNKIQSGEGLETPFDGKGVLVGIIDQSFQFNHIAFYDEEGNTRIVQLWDHETDVAKPYKPGFIPPKDGLDGSLGHATHVTNIAAGSKITKAALGTNADALTYYGMAPKADLYLVASQFSSPNILEEVKAIYAYAKKHGQPCVINMSFGSQIGPHDGTTDYDRAVSRIIEEASEDDNPRLIICAANGNEGGTPIHAHYKFKDGRKKMVGTKLVTEEDYVDILTQPNSKKIALGCLWGSYTDGRVHFEFSPYIKQGNKRTDLNAVQMASLQFQTDVDPVNGKQFVVFQCTDSQLRRITGDYLGPDCQLGIRVKGPKDSEIHGWMQPEYGTWARSGTGYTIDDKYLVGEGAASIPNAFAVAAYEMNGNSSGAMAYFSSPGPWLGKENKPDVSSPGVNIMSALNSERRGFESTDMSYRKIRIRKNGQTTSYYYGPMSGTSMATPAVTGIMALWLQANPTLTRTQIFDIIKETSVHDQYTGSKAWSPKAGYGKIDAYAGIKKALELKKQNGIDDVFGSEQPMTISRKEMGWKLLFNNDESRADIAVYSTTGNPVWQKHLSAPQCGQEVSVDYSDFTPGIYILRITTPKASYTRKFLVK